MLEAQHKAKIVKSIKDSGGYGRRYEDQFAVGLPDLILAPKGSLVTYFVEVKRITANLWGCSFRQLIELDSINKVRGNQCALMLGIHEGDKNHKKAFYLSSPSLKVYKWDCDEFFQLSEIPDRLERYWRNEQARRDTAEPAS